MFAQETIKVEDVAREMQATQAAIGSGVDVAAFVKDALRAHGAVLTAKNGTIAFDVSEASRALREAIGEQRTFVARFELPIHESEVYLNRTHPIVEGLATHVMDTALDPL